MTASFHHMTPPHEQAQPGSMPQPVHRGEALPMETLYPIKVVLCKQNMPQNGILNTINSYFYLLD
jgi:hypothetical protein